MKLRQPRFEHSLSSKNAEIILDWALVSPSAVPAIPTMAPFQPVRLFQNAKLWRSRSAKCRRLLKSSDFYGINTEQTIGIHPHSEELPKGWLLFALYDWPCPFGRRSWVFSPRATGEASDLCSINSSNESAKSQLQAIWQLLVWLQRVPPKNPNWWREKSTLIELPKTSKNRGRLSRFEANIGKPKSSGSCLDFWCSLFCVVSMFFRMGHGHLKSGWKSNMVQLFWFWAFCGLNLRSARNSWKLNSGEQNRWAPSSSNSKELQRNPDLSHELMCLSFCVERIEPPSQGCRGEHTWKEPNYLKPRGAPWLLGGV